MRIAIFYHCLFFLGNPPVLLPHALQVVKEQKKLMEVTGLIKNAGYMLVGVNGGEESEHLARGAFPNARLVFHGLESRNENLTIVEMEKWVRSHHDWYVLYLHSKGATHGYGGLSGGQRERWRNCMMRHLVGNWRECVKDLDAGFESVGCHWLSKTTAWRIRIPFPPDQSMWAGNFFWAKASFLATLPSILLRDRIKLSGIKSLESRFEAEVWIGNGKRLPIVKDYHRQGFLACP